jgi:uncharacterized membrane protein YgcG
MKGLKRFREIFPFAAGFTMPRSGMWNPVSLLLLALCIAAWPLRLPASQYQYQGAQAPPPEAQEGPEQLQQLVAPIALYPDSLVSQILAASTYPEQVADADRWMQANQNLPGDAVGQAVNQQPWDPSVKALTAFPSVLGNMDENLSWTSSLGDAYYNQPGDVMDAIQVMRERAQAAGNLQSNPQENVSDQDSDIGIEPANPDEVYVPAYNPWTVYGEPIGAWPGWYPYPGVWFGGPYISFGIPFGIGRFGGYGWGWNHWGCDWRGRSVLYDHNSYRSRSATFYHRGNYYRGGARRGDVNGGRGQADNRFAATPQPFNGDVRAARGYAAPRAQSGLRTSAFSGYKRGGEEKSFSARGSSSFGGGGFHGAGGFHGGGGFHGAGGRR